MALGRRNRCNRDERFSMAVLALNTSAYRNAVSRLHREVSQEMFHDLWPELPVWEVPITSITNGVHLPELAERRPGRCSTTSTCEPDWRERFNDPDIWEQIDDIPDEELLEVHRRRKRRLVTFVRDAPACLAPCAARRRARSAAQPAKCSTRTRSPSASPAASPPTSAPRCSSATSSG